MTRSTRTVSLQSAVTKHNYRNFSGRKNCGRKRCTKNRDNYSLEKSKQRPFKNLGNFTRSGLRQESVHQEPPCTDTSRTKATSVAFLMSTHS